MSSRNHSYGYDIEYDYDKKQFLYVDDGTVAVTTHSERPCKKCNRLPTKDGHDPCIPNLPGVEFACCGHGETEGYIKFNDGQVIRFYLTETETTENEYRGAIEEYVNT